MPPSKKRKIATTSIAYDEEDTPATATAESTVLSSVAAVSSTENTDGSKPPSESDVGDKTLDRQQKFKALQARAVREIL